MIDETTAAILIRNIMLQLYDIRNSSGNPDVKSGIKRSIHLIEQILKESSFPPDCLYINPDKMNGES